MADLKSVAKKNKFFTFALLFISLYIGSTIFQNACPAKSEKKTQARVVNFDVVKTTIKIGPNEERVVPLDDRWSGWITIDPRVNFSGLVVDRSNRSRSCNTIFQFRNGTVSVLSEDDHMRYEPWMKTFRVRLEKGTAKLVIVTNSARGSRTSLTIPH